MNIEQAKQMALRDVLASLGHLPVRERKGECWYCSPLREEQTPSFKISRDGRAWYDHGAGLGGNVLDFVMAYFQTDLSSALQALSSLQIAHPPAAAPSPIHALAQSALEPAMTVTKMQPVTSRALIAYLRQRGIPPDVAQPYVQELHYEREGQPYFALAFANDSGGYELRNPYFKGTQGAKDITLIRPKDAVQGSAAVFEGFMDFLSAVMLVGRPPRMPVIVMNSTAMKDKTLEAIRTLGATTVYLYLDWDATGRQLTAAFQEALTGVEVQDKAEIYAGCKDLNEWVQGRQQALHGGKLLKNCALTGKE